MASLAYDGLMQEHMIQYTAQGIFGFGSGAALSMASDIAIP